MNKFLFNVYLGLKDNLVPDVIKLIIENVRYFKYYDDKPFIDMEKYIINLCKNKQLIVNYNEEIVYCNNDIHFTFERVEYRGYWYNIKLHFYGFGSMKEKIKNQIQSLIMLNTDHSSIRPIKSGRKNSIYVRKICNNREYKNFDRDYQLYINEN